jgi:hypothetical protein
MPGGRNELADSIDSQTGEALFPTANAAEVANAALAAGNGGASTPVGTIQAAAAAALAAQPIVAVTDQPITVDPQPVQQPGTST